MYQKKRKISQKYKISKKKSKIYSKIHEVEGHPKSKLDFENKKTNHCNIDVVWQKNRENPPYFSGGGHYAKMGFYPVASFVRMFKGFF